MQSDASSSQTECSLANVDGENAVRHEVTHNIDNDLKVLAESFQQVCRKLGDSGKEHHEIAQTIRRMAAIAKEICSLSEYEVPTMRKTYD